MLLKNYNQLQDIYKNRMKYLNSLHDATIKTNNIKHC